MLLTPEICDSLLLTFERIYEGYTIAFETNQFTHSLIFKVYKYYENNPVLNISIDNTYGLTPESVQAIIHNRMDGFLGRSLSLEKRCCECCGSPIGFLDTKCTICGHELMFTEECK